jgi:hypothetical protein
MLKKDFLFSKQVKLGENWEDGQKQSDVMVPLHHIFCPVFGCHYLGLEDGWILLVTHFDHSPEFQSYFESLDEVAYLPDPTTEGDVKLKKYVDTADKHGYTQKHHDMLKTVVAVADTDTVHHLHEKAAKQFCMLEFRVSPKPILYVDHIEVTHGKGK